jgi:CHAT domain-containing protein
MFDGPSEVPSPETNYKLGSIALLQNKPEKARDYLDKCLDRIKRRGGKQRLEIKALIGKSVSWQIEGEYGKALEFSKQATEVNSSEGKYLAWSSLGACYLRLYQPDLALAMLDSASTAYLSSKQAMQESQGFLSDFQRITGEAHLLAGDPELALRFFQRALVENHQYFADSLDLVSNPDFTGVKDPIDFIKALRGKAKAWALTQGDGEQWTNSLTTYELAMEWVDSLRSDYTSETAQLGWSETFKSTFEGAIEVAFQLYAKTQDVVYLEKAFQFSEKSKNALLLEQLKGGQGKSYAGIPDTILAREKELLVDLAYYTKALRAAEHDRDSSRIGLYRPYLAQTRIDLASHQEMMERDYPKYRQLKGEITTPAPQRVRSELLDGQTAFLSYFIGKDSAYVLVLTRETEAFVALGGSTKLKLLINNFLKQLKNVDGFREQLKASKEAFVTNGTQLYDAVLRAPLATLPTGVDRLIRAGDGQLSGVPLSALPRTETGGPTGSFRELPYLLRDYRVQYAYSAALQLEALQKSRKRPAKLECLGLAPDYEGESGESMNTALNRSVTLAGTAREVKGIFKHVKGEYDTTSTATKEFFIERAGDFKILHLAMHGLADPEAPDLNHLMFADADGRGDNLLYHHEIANMDLSAQLVVLSACETGVGKHEVGEGVFSLARSFSYAGIPSIVMSLWSADDVSTSELMPEFYEQLATGAEQHVALQRAKIAFLENANSEQLHPYFWATFVGVGDTNSVIGNGWSWWWFLSVIVLGGGLWWRLSRSA